MPNLYSLKDYPSRKALVENSMILGFALFTLLGILRHELWRDELQAWMLARDNASIVELLTNMKYEGHPALWHLCLYGLTQITHNPLAMQLFHWLIAIGVMWLIVKFSPFPILHKLLLSFNYFFFFEYAVISRGYSLGLFFLLLFCAIYDREKPRPIYAACILVLAANTSAYGLLLSSSMAFFMFMDYVISLRPRSYKAIAYIQGALILGMGWLISGGQIIRAKWPTESDAALMRPLTDFSVLQVNTVVDVQESFGLADFVKNIANAIAHVWDSYFPIPRLFNIHFWNHNILTENYIYPSIGGISLGDYIALLLSAIIFVVVVYLLASKPIILWTYGFGNLALFAFRVFVHETTSVRHYGHFFIMFFLCCWLFLKLPATSGTSQVAGDGKRSRFLINYLMPVLFSVQAMSGIYAMSMDYLLPFSNSEETAAFLVSEGLQERFILGDNDKFVSVISGYLEVPVYYPEKQALATYWTFEPPELSEADLRESIEQQVQIHEEGIVVILSAPLSLSMMPGVEIRPLAQFTNSIVADENYYVYVAQKSDLNPLPRA